MPILGITMPNMGKSLEHPTHRPPTGLADALFPSTRRRVLACLFGRPNRSFYATELMQLTGGGSGAVQRELARLAQSGLATVRRIGNQKHYQANPESPIFSELRGIVDKTLGLAEPLRQVLAPMEDRIFAAFVFGSVAKREDTVASDIDLMVISDTLAYSDVFSALAGIEAQLGRPINPTLYSRKEFDQRVREGHSFVRRALSQPKIWLMGEESGLTSG